MVNDQLIVCRCEEVTLGEIKEAVQDGATTVGGVKKRTRACMGMCQGRVCKPLVEKVLNHETGDANGNNTETSFRPPARPVLLGEIIKNN